MWALLKRQDPSIPSSSESRFIKCITQVNGSNDETYKIIKLRKATRMIEKRTKAFHPTIYPRICEMLDNNLFLHSSRDEYARNWVSRDEVLLFLQALLKFIKVDAISMSVYFANDFIGKIVNLFYCEDGDLRENLSKSVVLLARAYPESIPVIQKIFGDIILENNHELDVWNGIPYIMKVLIDIIDLVPTLEFRDQVYFREVIMPLYKSENNLALYTKPLNDLVAAYLKVDKGLSQIVVSLLAKHKFKRFSAELSYLEALEGLIPHLTLTFFSHKFLLQSYIFMSTNSSNLVVKNKANAILESKSFNYLVYNQRNGMDNLLYDANIDSSSSRGNIVLY